MQRVQSIKRYIKKQPLAENVKKHLTGDMSTLILHGCEVEVLIDESGKHMVLRTKNPVSILKLPDGQALQVIEMHPSHPKYPKE